MKCLSVQLSILSSWLKLDTRILSHDILNLIERLRIMHDLAKDQNFSAISKDEIKSDLDETLKELEAKFKSLLQ